jgi:hypothetical protein
LSCSPASYCSKSCMLSLLAAAQSQNYRKQGTQVNK